MDLIGKQLPSVSAADNGKVLGVENGHWRAIMNTPATAADMVYIPYQSLTYNSITDVLAAGQTPFTKHTVIGDEYTFYLMLDLKTSAPSRYVFVCVTQEPGASNIFLMHFLQVTPTNKVIATEEFYNRTKVDSINSDTAILTNRLNLKQLPVTVSGSISTLDFTNQGGIQNALLQYSLGSNFQFIGLNVQSSPDNTLIFTICGMDTSTTNMHVDLSCVSDGRAYYVRLRPVDTNVMRGTLVETVLGT